MKSSKPLLILSAAALALALASLALCLLLLNRQNQWREKMDAISGQIVQLAAVTEPDKAQWIENVKPGFNGFHSSAFGYFDYPAEWGQPYATRTHYANGIYHGNRWDLSFGGLGPMADWVKMEAYHHDPSANVHYPFGPSLSSENLSLMASAAFTQGNSAPQACAAYKKLHALSAECQMFSESIFSISGESETVWFAASPTRTDTTQQADYPGVLIHASEGHDTQMRDLLKSLQPQGQGPLLIGSQDL